jgi:hypothetical protein
VEMQLLTPHLYKMQLFRDYNKFIFKKEDNGDGGRRDDAT